MITVAALRRLALAALVVLALLVAPGRAAAENDFNIVEFSITNSTPVTLKRADSEFTNKLACWGDSTDPTTETCVDQPPAEIDPGQTVTVYVTDFGEFFQTTTGDVRYLGDPNSGFNMSAALIAFNVPITQPNEASCTTGGYFVCTGLTFNQHGTPMKASATIVATDTCPGAAGPCPWSADAIWDSAGPGFGGFDSPSAVSLDGQSHAYVADTGNKRIASFDTDGSWWETWAAGWQNPLAVAADPRTPSASFDGAVYVTDTADTVNGNVEAFTPTGGFIDSTAPPGPFAPTAVAVGPDGRVYALDTSRTEVVVFGSDTTFQTAWGARGSGPGEFNSPRGIAVDASGQVYIADTGNDRIQVLTSDGRYLDSFDGGPGSGKLDAPGGVAAVPVGQGFVAVTDTGNDRVQVFTPDGHPLGPFGQEGSGTGEFEGPRAIAGDDQGTLYVADTGNDRVQKFSFASSQASFVTAPGSRAHGAARRTRMLRLRARTSRRSVPVGLRCSSRLGARRCRVLVTFHSRSGLLGRKTLTIPARSTTTTRVPLSRAARARLRGGRTVTGRLLAHTHQPTGRVLVTDDHRASVRPATRSRR
jgi:sugar lactone lactonase YvrE